MFLIVILCFRGPCLLVLANDLPWLITPKDLLELIIATDEPSRPSPKDLGELPIAEDVVESFMLETWMVGLHFETPHKVKPSHMQKIIA